MKTVKKVVKKVEPKKKDNAKHEKRETKSMKLKEKKIYKTS